MPLNVYAKVRSINNALDLGMINDGVTDNTPLLTNALMTLSNKGENSLFIPPIGSFNFVVNSTPIALPANFNLSGGGKGSIIKISPSSWTGISNNMTKVFMSYNTGNFISGLYFDGQNSLVNSGNTTTYGLAFLNRSSETVSDCTFEDLQFQNQVGGPATENFCLASGKNSTRLKFVRIYCNNGYGTGISINGDMTAEYVTANSLPNDIDIIDCTANGMIWKGMTLYGARNIRVRNYSGKYNGSNTTFGGSAINMEWCDDIDILGCRGEYNQGPGLVTYGWQSRIRIRDCIFQNNNQLDLNGYGEIACKTSSWFSSTNPYASSRLIIQGVMQDITISNCKIVPKTTGTYNVHLHLEADPFVNYPTTSNTQPYKISITGDDISSWRFSGLGHNVYCYNNGAYGSWLPNTAYSAGSIRVNGGYNLICNVGGTSVNVGTLGPLATANGQNITDGTITWTSQNTAVDVVLPGSFWCANTGYANNEVRTNNGFAYRANTGASNSATSGTGTGPQNTTYGNTETDGGITWTCLGRVQTSTLSAGNFVPKILDNIIPNIKMANIPNLPTYNTPVYLWTANNVSATSYTGGGDTSGAAVILTANTIAATGNNGAGTRIQDTKYLPSNMSFLASIRYLNNTTDNGWHFAIRPSGFYSSSTGFGQFDVQLSSFLGNTSGWNEAQIVFTMPSTTVSKAFICYMGNNPNSSIIIDSVNIIPLKDNNYRQSEITVGGKKIYYGPTPTNEDFDPGDRILSNTAFGGDQICTVSGSYATINSSTTFTMGTSTNAGTMNQADPAVRAGLWVTIPAANASATPGPRKIVYVSGNNFNVDNQTSSTSNVVAVTPTILNPVFVTANVVSIKTSITAKAGGGMSGATQLNAGWNLITVCASVGDSVQLPVALQGTYVTAFNQGANSALTYSNTSSDYINGVAGTTGFSIAANTGHEFYCVTNNHWYTI